MGNTESEIEGQVFSSAEVCRIAQVSARQLQWWDERDVISPRHTDHRRLYLLNDVLQVLTVAALREKGLSLQKIRRILRLLRRELEEQTEASWNTSPRLYLLTDCHSLYLTADPQQILDRLVEARKPMYLVNLTDQLQRVLSQKPHPRHASKQLRLF